MRGTLQSKVGASLTIFFISLFAVSFPSVAKRVKRLRVPPIVFFVGKHFGTGVILCTAFVHLLPDAFSSLQTKWTGLIILSSLLAIFLVEYISTAYVDHLQSYSSAPPTPKASPPISRPHSLSDSRDSCGSDSHKKQSALVHVKDVPVGEVGEQSPLINDLAAPPSSSYGIRNGAGISEALITTPYDTISSRQKYNSHSRSASSTQHQKVDTDDPIFGSGHHRHESRQFHTFHSGRGKKIAAAVALLGDEDPDELIRGSQTGSRSKADSDVMRSHVQQHSHEQAHGHGHGRGQGHGHTHLDMENWDADASSLLAEHEEHGEEVMVGRRRQVVGILMLQMGIMMHSLVIGLTLAITKGPEFTTLVTAILFHQLFEGLSLGIRIAGLPSESKSGAISGIPGHILKPILATTFALTTPLGIAVGLRAFSGGSQGDGSNLNEIQGLMSAMSAGMLIYAACVEMLAGDFVMDPQMWRCGLKRQVIALLSLVAGVCAMASIGLYD